MRHKALRRTIAVRLCHKSIRMGSAPIGINVYSHLGDGELFTKRQSSLSPTRGTSFDRMALERRFERLALWCQNSVPKVLFRTTDHPASLF